MDKRDAVWDELARNSSIAGGLSSVRTYRHCADSKLDENIYAYRIIENVPAAATVLDGNLSRFSRKPMRNGMR